jgi:large subunit ribosomal protein L28
MSRCELTGKGPVVTNLVSHSNIKTKSTSLPNVQNKRVFSAALNELVGLKMATSTIKSIEHVGNFDKYILQRPDEVLSKRALTVKNRIKRRLSGKVKKSNPGSVAAVAKVEAAPRVKKSAQPKAASTKAAAPAKAKTSAEATGAKAKKPAKK